MKRRLLVLASVSTLAFGCAAPPTPVVQSFALDGEGHSSIASTRAFAFRGDSHDGIFATSQNLVRYRPGHDLESLLSTAREDVVDLCFAEEDTLFVLTRQGLCVFYGGRLVRLDEPGTAIAGAAGGVDTSKGGTGLRGRYSFRSISRLFPDDEGFDDAFERVDPTIDFAGGSTFVLPVRSASLTAVWTGFLHAESSGEYTFAVMSRNGDLAFDGTLLFIDGAPVVSVSGTRTDGEKTGTLRLAAGLHHLRLEYRAIGASRLCSLRWKPPGASKAEPVPTANLYPEVDDESHLSGCLARDGEDRLWLSWQTDAGESFIELLDDDGLKLVARVDTPVADMASAPDGVFVAAGGAVARLAPLPGNDGWRLVPLATVVGGKIVSVTSDAENEILYVASPSTVFALVDGALRPLLPLGGRIRKAAEWLYIASESEGEIVRVKHPEVLARSVVRDGGIDIAGTPLHGDGSPRRGMSAKSREQIVERNLKVLFEGMFGN